MAQRKIINNSSLCVLASLRLCVKKNMNKLKFALIGTGGIAQTYAQAFQTSDCCKLVAVADINQDSAKAFGTIRRESVFGLQNFSRKERD